MFAIAADEAKPAVAAADKPAKKAKAIKLVKPWSSISSLTDEQKAKLDQIHKKALADINAIKAKEKEDSLAVLDDKQREEVMALTEKETAQKKMKKTNSPEKAG